MTSAARRVTTPDKKSACLPLQLRADFAMSQKYTDLCVKAELSTSHIKGIGSLARDFEF